MKTIVTRYKDSPTIFAWELMNEARCLSDTLPAGPSCVPGSNTLRTWYQEQSNYVRSLYVNRFNITHHDRLIHTFDRDHNHLITTGGEGHFYWKNPRK